MDSAIDETHDQSDKEVAVVIVPQVLHLLQDRGIPQRTSGWLAARETLLTASEVSGALKMTPAACRPYVKQFGLEETFVFSSKKSCNPYLTTQALIKKKSNPNSASDSMNGDFMAWGTLYEEVARQIYQQMTGETVHEFGLLVHPTEPWVGASPDGVTSSGKVVEIKVPSVRRPHHIPPLWYVQQMWWQMLVCGLDHGDFFDVRIIEWTSEAEWHASALTKAETADNPSRRRHHTHGIVCQNPETGLYVYAPETTVEISDFLTWAHAQRSSNGMTLIYYEMIEFALVPVTLDPEWFASNKKELLSVMHAIEHARANVDGTVQPAVKRARKSKPLSILSECLI